MILNTSIVPGTKGSAIFFFFLDFITHVLVILALIKYIF